MRLPILLSVPHAGHRVPPALQAQCILPAADLLADGDVGAREIYALADHVEAFVTTDVARAVVDLNRAPDDMRADGVVKTHTCWGVPIWDPPLAATQVDALLEMHADYHARLSSLAAAHGHKAPLVAGVDCHTMAAKAPPEAPDPGQARPPICLSDAHGAMPAAWFRSLAGALEDAFGCQVACNQPFQGGHIIRAHAHEMPWVQLELSRDPWMDVDAKRRAVLEAITAWVDEVASSAHDEARPPGKRRRPRPSPALRGGTRSSRRPGRGVPPQPPRTGASWSS